MSSGSDNKMYNYEVTPPVGMWEKIAAELDESELSQQFPSKLYNTEIPPPSHIWQSVAVALDESAFINDFASKLSGAKVAPPATVWNKIANSLDENDYASKLSRAEVVPPAAVWNKIAISLDVEKEEAIPERRRIFPLLKYAAAAAIIGIIAWGSVKLLSGNAADKDGLAKKGTTNSTDNKIETASTSPQTTTTFDNIGATDVTASLEEARNEAALEESKRTYARLDASSIQRKVKHAADFYFVAPPEDIYPTGTTRGLDINDIVEPADPSIADRYITLMTPDGNIIRMSKKLSNLVCCVSGEEQDKDCIDQMKKWREKLASPSNTHSPNNFMDILNLVSSLQDN